MKAILQLSDGSELVIEDLVTWESKHGTLTLIRDTGVRVFDEVQVKHFIISRDESEQR